MYQTPAQAAFLALEHIDQFPALAFYRGQATPHSEFPVSSWGLSVGFVFALQTCRDCTDPLKDLFEPFKSNLASHKLASTSFNAAHSTLQANGAPVYYQMVFI